MSTTPTRSTTTGPTPRLSRTPVVPGRPAPRPGSDTAAILEEIGMRDRMAEFVRTDGLAYPLAGESLEPGSSRGVSNVFVSEMARVSVERGVLLAIRPGPEPGEGGLE